MALFGAELSTPEARRGESSGGGGGSSSGTDRSIKKEETGARRWGLNSFEFVRRRARNFHGWMMLLLPLLLMMMSRRDQATRRSLFTQLALISVHEKPGSS